MIKQDLNDVQLIKIISKKQAETQSLITELFAGANLDRINAAASDDEQFNLMANILEKLKAQKNSLSELWGYLKSVGAVRSLDYYIMKRRGN
jgi:hypothetical protein